MKKLLHTIILLICLFIAQAANAVSFNVLVLPVDLMNVCDNYYCYSEVSEIIADDLIEYFKYTGGKVNAPPLVEVRKRLAANPSLRTQLQTSLNEYRSKSEIDFKTYKTAASLFSANSVLIVSNTVPVENAYIKRNVWEILELSTTLDFSYPYYMTTQAVLLDTVNDLVMWSGTYTKKISDSNGNFSAPKASQSYAKYGFIQFYSKDIISKTIAENVVLRFFPKTINPIVNPSNIKPTGEFLRYESNTPVINKRPEREELDPDKEQFGELIFGF